MSKSDELPSRKRSRRSIVARPTANPQPPPPPEDPAKDTLPDPRELLAALRAAILDDSNEEQGLFAMRSLTRYQGPIPPASEIRAWEKASPGSASRILAITEKRQANTFELNKLMIIQEGKLRLGGQNGALVGLLAMLAVTAFGIYEKQALLAGTFGVLTIISVVGMFLHRQATIKSGGAEVRIGLDDD